MSKISHSRRRHGHHKKTSRILTSLREVVRAIDLFDHDQSTDFIDFAVKNLGWRAYDHPDRLGG